MYDQSVVLKAREMRKAGASFGQIAKALGMANSTAQAMCRGELLNSTEARKPRKKPRVIVPMHDHTVVLKARELRKQGLKFSDIGEALGISRSTAYTFCQEGFVRGSKKGEGTTAAQIAAQKKAKSAKKTATEVQNTESGAKAAELADAQNPASIAQATALSSAQDTSAQTVATAISKTKTANTPRIVADTLWPSLNSANTLPKSVKDSSNAPTVISEKVDEAREQHDLKYGPHVLLAKVLDELNLESTIKRAIKQADVSVEISYEELIDLAAYSLFTAQGCDYNFDEYAHEHYLFSQGLGCVNKEQIAHWLKDTIFDLKEPLCHRLTTDLKNLDELVITVDMSDYTQRPGNLSIIQNVGEYRTIRKNSMHALVARRAYDGLPVQLNVYPTYQPTLKSTLDFAKKLPDYDCSRQTVFMDKGVYSAKHIQELEANGFNIVCYCDARSNVITDLINKYGEDLLSLEDPLRADLPHIHGITRAQVLFGEVRFCHLFFDESIKALGLIEKEQAGLIKNANIIESLQAYQHGFRCIITDSSMDFLTAFDSYYGLTKTQNVIKLPQLLLKQSLKSGVIPKAVIGSCVVRMLSSLLESYINSKLKIQRSIKDHTEQCLNATKALEQLESIRLVGDGILEPFKVDAHLDSRTKHILKCFDISALKAPVYEDSANHHR
ncbi:hypothetical protein [Anaerobiospirillum succiniciproducens]|uniref:hypothetical protein n=1 Tax=Anaerobiospirillum succiniciproducens TaxID=13335 RepID=UPI002941CC98|nr:hypothetical protein [Anaerobiospirillum succiniciproducens]